MSADTKRVEGVVLVEVEIPAGEDPRAGFMRRLDAFRESVLPGQEHGVHILAGVVGPDGSGPQLVLLGERERQALNAVLDYCTSDEAQDFREQFEFDPDPERESSHVLTNLVTLSNALLGETATPRGVAGLEEEEV